MAEKIVTVVGATGAQGGSLARALLADSSGEWVVRAVTRKPDGEPARALAEQGAELVEADVDRPETLRKAFDGAHGAYCVTNFWEHFSAEKEIEQARNLAEAVRAAGVHHVIWSTLEDTRRKVPLSDDRMPTLQGRFKVPHYDTKGEADAFFDPKQTTWMLTSFYWDNLIHFGMGPKPDESGKLALVLPMADKKLPGIAAEDIGKCAAGIFRRGDAAIGKRIGIAGEHLTGAEMAAGLTQALEREVIYKAVTPADYRGFGFPGADDLGNMFQYKAEFESDYCGARDLKTSRELNPELQTFSQWLARNKSRIPVG